MLSVLIPVYNCSITALIKDLHQQLMSSNIEFEIICLDDASNNTITKKNSTVNNYKNVSYNLSKTNNGRVKTRQLLSEKALHNWLLFLDADVLPKSKNFISNYLKHINDNYDVIYGGFTYHTSKPDKTYMLRWKYGKSKEEIDAVKRNVKPYKVVISGNFLIKKETYQHIVSKINYKGYGYDNYFGALMKENNINVLHINNEVYHLGIEKSSTYLNKVEQSVDNLLNLQNTQKIVVSDNDLLRLFNFTKSLKLNYFLSFLHSTLNSRIKKNLLGNNPLVFLLQLYKLTYFCYKDLKK